MTSVVPWWRDRDDEGYASTSSFVARTLCDAVGLQTDTTTLPVRGPEMLSSLLEAAVENEGCPFDRRDAIVQAALERRLLD